jgi:hypothetical protein
MINLQRHVTVVMMVIVVLALAIATNAVARPTLAGPPDINRASKAEMTALYFGYHTMTKGYYNLNDGDLTTCKPGKTFPVWRHSLIASTNFYRRMAGYAPNMDVVEAPAAELERIQRAQTVQGSARSATGHVVYGHGIAGQPTATCAKALNWNPDDYTSTILAGGNRPDVVSIFITDPGSNNTGVGHRDALLDPNYKWIAWGGTTWEPEDGLGGDVLAAFTDWRGYPGPQMALDESYDVAWPPPGNFPWPLLPRISYERGDSIVGARLSFHHYPGRNAEWIWLDKATAEVRVNGQLKSVRVESQGALDITIAVDDAYHSWKLPPVDKPDVIEVTIKGRRAHERINNELVWVPRPDVKWTTVAYNPFDDGGGTGDQTASRVIEYYIGDLGAGKKDHYFYTITDPAIQYGIEMPRNETCSRLNGNLWGASQCVVFLTSLTAYLDPTVRPKDETWVVDEGLVGPWERTWRGFFAWKKAVAPFGSVPVARFYCGPCNSHFYTASTAERDFLQALNPTNDAKLGWALETAEAFFIRLPQNGQCPANTLPVYRAYNQGDDASTVMSQRGRGANHLLTLFAADVRSAVAKGWKDEGVVMCSPVRRPVEKHMIGAHPGPYKFETPPYTSEYRAQWVAAF